MACWSNRGCDDEMRERCPHAINPAEQCPLSCLFSKCSRETHCRTSDPWVLLDPTVERSAAAKEVCTTCEFFLKNGPRI